MECKCIFCWLKVIGGRRDLIFRQEHSAVVKYRLPLCVARDKDVVYFSDDLSHTFNHPQARCALCEKPLENGFSSPSTGRARNA